MGTRFDPDRDREIGEAAVELLRRLVLAQVFTRHAPGIEAEALELVLRWDGDPPERT